MVAALVSTAGCVGAFTLAAFGVRRFREERRRQRPSGIYAYLAGCASLVGGFGVAATLVAILAA